MIYFLDAEGIGRIKIGFTTNRKTLFTRLNALSAQAPAKLVLLSTVAGGKDLERSLHLAFRQHRVFGEWFSDNRALRNLALRLKGVSDASAMSIIKSAIAIEDAAAREIENAQLEARQKTEKVDVGKIALEGVSKFVVKHGVNLTAKLSGASKDSVRNWRAMANKPRFYHVVPLIRYDNEPFAGTPFGPQPQPELTREERFLAIQQELDALRRMIPA